MDIYFLLDTHFKNECLQKKHNMLAFVIISYATFTCKNEALEDIFKIPH